MEQTNNLISKIDSIKFDMDTVKLLLLEGSFDSNIKDELIYWSKGIRKNLDDFIDTIMCLEASKPIEDYTFSDREPNSLKNIISKIKLKIMENK